MPKKQANKPKWDYSQTPPKWIWDPLVRVTNWCLVINNPSKDTDLMEAEATSKGWKLTGELEVGKEGTPHKQLQINCGKTVFASEIKKVFTTPHFSPARNVAALTEYNNKEGNASKYVPPENKMFISQSKFWQLFFTKCNEIVDEDRERDCIRLIREHVMGHGHVRGRDTPTTDGTIVNGRWRQIDLPFSRYEAYEKTIYESKDVEYKRHTMLWRFICSELIAEGYAVDSFMVNPQYISNYHQAARALYIRTSEEIFQLSLADKRKVEFLEDGSEKSETSHEENHEESQDEESESGEESEASDSEGSSGSSGD